MNCAYPSKSTNGRYFLISINGTEVDTSTSNKTVNVNTILSFKCSGGFSLVDKYDSFRTCQQNKTWSGMEHTCIVIIAIEGRGLFKEEITYLLPFAYINIFNSLDEMARTDTYRLKYTSKKIFLLLIFFSLSFLRVGCLLKLLRCTQRSVS